MLYIVSQLDVKGYIKDKLLQKSLKIGVTDGFVHSVSFECERVYQQVNWPISPFTSNDDKK